MRSIAYLRQCTDTDIRRKVTFHLVVDDRHFPGFLRKLHPGQGKTTPPPSNPSTSTAAPPSDKRVVKVSISQQSQTFSTALDKFFNEISSWDEKVVSSRATLPISPVLVALSSRGH